MNNGAYAMPLYTMSICSKGSNYHPLATIRKFFLMEHVTQHQIYPKILLSHFIQELIFFYTSSFWISQAISANEKPSPLNRQICSSFSNFPSNPGKWG